ncbi:MAG: hypothetical protein PHE43_04365 [Candidatus Nanoarchaeia archaeon]|nr:hypothetical protein [Candidatus Nanoarchaeia archaeon]
MKINKKFVIILGFVILLTLKFSTAGYEFNSTLGVGYTSQPQTAIYNSSYVAILVAGEANGYYVYVYDINGTMITGATYLGYKSAASEIKNNQISGVWVNETCFSGSLFDAGANDKTAFYRDMWGNQYRADIDIDTNAAGPSSSTGYVSTKNNLFYTWVDSDDRIGYAMTKTIDGGAVAGNISIGTVESFNDQGRDVVDVDCGLMDDGDYCAVATYQNYARDVITYFKNASIVGTASITHSTNAGNASFPYGSARVAVINSTTAVTLWYDGNNESYYNLQAYNEVGTSLVTLAFESTPSIKAINSTYYYNLDIARINDTMFIVTVDNTAYVYDDQLKSLYNYTLSSDPSIQMVSIGGRNLRKDTLEYSALCEAQGRENPIVITFYNATTAWFQPYLVGSDTLTEWDGLCISTKYITNLLNSTGVLSYESSQGTFTDTYYNDTDQAIKLNPGGVSGTYLSNVLDTKTTANWSNFSWLNESSWAEEVIVNITFFIHTCDDSSCTGETTWNIACIESPCDLQELIPYSRYLQYKLEMSTNDSVYSPLIYQVNISYINQYTPTIPDLNLVQNETSLPRTALYDQVYLNWSNSTDENGDLINYYLEVASDSAFSSIVFTNSSIEESTNTTTDYLIPIANSMTTDAYYFWRVLATDGISNSSWSETRAFNFSSIVTMTGESVSFQPSVKVLTNSSFVYVWCDPADFTKKYIVYDTNGTVIRTTTSVSEVGEEGCGENVPTQVVDVSVINSTAFLIIYSDHIGLKKTFAKLMDIYGSTITKFDIDDVSGLPSDANSTAVSIVALNETVFAASWYDSYDGLRYFNVMDIYNTNISENQTVNNILYGYLAAGLKGEFGEDIFVQTTSATTAVAKLYYSNGSQRGATITIDTDTGTNGYPATVTVLNESSFIVAWHDDMDNEAYYAQYDRDGNALTTNYSLSTDGSLEVSAPRAPYIAAINETSFGVGFNYGSSGQTYIKTYAESYSATPTYNNLLFTGTSTARITVGGDERATSTGFCEPDAFVVVWSDTTPEWDLVKLDGTSWNGYCAPETADACAPPSSDWILNQTCHWVSQSYDFEYNLLVQDAGKLYLTSSSFNFTSSNQNITIQKGGEIRLNETSQIG